ncbi:ABC transporter permease [Spongiactinospora gelatinilytica]|uniref:ABC transporter permease n=1 Tax=Spongiactinospora gelatinilytica TaxID=2666298 RepID=A0A2W2H5W0_9ACTN|nr:ABC transporter permease [Spongiactinospora gelatinilytica]PZG47355.1 ABC transporter permease [Spongiactinospora gelatinilytica]
MRALAAELAKLASLPAAWVAAATGVLVPSAVAAMTARGGPVPGGEDIGYQELAFGVLGAIVLGVVAISSEYVTESAESGGGRQITTSLTAVPSRTRFLLAKMGAVAIGGALLAVVAAAATMGVVQAGAQTPPLGAGDVPRLAGVVCYWALTALLAFGVTVLTRHGVVPLALFIVNTSVVSVTYLLTKITLLANYLPDMAGVRMFIRRLPDNDVEIAPLTAGLVMAAWVAALLVVATVVFTRRDA